MKSTNVNEVSSIFASFGLENINEELTARNMPNVEVADNGANLLAIGVRSLDEFAATVINLAKGAIEPATMTGYMVKAFPGHKIGERHGPHYISLARTGSLSPKCTVEVRYAPGKATRRATPKGYDLSGVNDKQLAAILKAVKGTPLEDMVSKELDTRNAPKAE
jgi:hypothetical protein